MLRAEHINPFLESIVRVCTSLLGSQPKRGRLSLRKGPFRAGGIAVILGVTGDLEGQVVFSFPRDTALAIVSRMMGMPIEELDELGRSALAEFGNIVSGNALMLMTKALKNISVDITPPSVITGEELEVSVENVPTLVIPVEVEGFGSFEVNVALKPKK